MSNKPLAYRLGLYISAAVLFVYSLFIIWAYQYNFMLAERDAAHNARAINNDIVDVVRQKVISTQEVAANMAVQFPFYHQHGATGEFLQGILRKYPHIWSIRIRMTPYGDPGKQFYLMSSRDDTTAAFTQCQECPGVCIDDKIAAENILSKGIPFWSEPFRCAQNQLILSVYRFPFVHTSDSGDTLLTGVVACQVSLDFLQDLIESVPKIGEGFAFLISAKGMFITHPFREYELTRSIYRLPKEIYPYDSATIARDFVQNQQPITVFPHPLDYKKSWAYPTLIPENNWIIAFVMPYSVFYRDLNWLLLRMILVSTVVAALIFFLVFAISRRLMQPISKISRELHNFSIEKLDLGPGVNNETVMLQESLVRLQKQYERNLQSEKELSLRRARLRADIQLASEIQRSFIPPAGNHYLHDAGLAIHAVYKPLLTVSGDLFDFFMISDHKMLVTIGDVSGGGIPAALFMGIAHTFIKSNAFAGDAKDIVDQVNKLLCKNNANQFFLSLFLGILDMETDTLNYCNAGHTPSFLVHSSGHVRELGDPHGLPLGLFPDRTYKDNHTRFSKGDLLIMYTDGVSEQLNENGEFFGVDNFYKVFDKIKNQTSEEVAGILLDELSQYAGETPQGDDLCLLVLKYE